MGYLEMRPEESYSMSARLPYWTLAPEAVKRMMAINSYLVGSGIEPSLRHLVWLRVSQINGCAYCVDLHADEALRDGETGVLGTATPLLPWIPAFRGNDKTKRWLCFIECRPRPHVALRLYGTG